MMPQQGNICYNNKLSALLFANFMPNGYFCHPVIVGQFLLPLMPAFSAQKNQHASNILWPCLL